MLRSIPPRGQRSTFVRRRACNTWAVQDIFEGLPIYMMVGIVIVIGASQINRVAGAVLSVIFWGAVAFVGNAAYDAGHAIGIPGFQFPRPLFFVICAAFAAMHVFAGYSYVRSKRHEAQRRRILAGEED